MRVNRKYKKLQKRGSLHFFLTIPYYTLLDTFKLKNHYLFYKISIIVFTDQQLDDIPVDNKVGENYFGQFTQQLRTKGGSAFKAITDRLILKSSSDLAFGEGAGAMLKDKELRSKKKEIDEIEADWSSA